MASRFSAAGPSPKLRPMHPRPIAETSRSFPSLRSCKVPPVFFSILSLAPVVGEIVFFEVHSDSQKGRGHQCFQHAGPDRVVMETERGIKKPCRGANKPYPIKVSFHSLVGCLRLFRRFGS